MIVPQLANPELDIPFTLLTVPEHAKDFAKVGERSSVSKFAEHGAVVIHLYST